MWNPWKVSCPACKATLEMSWVSKVAAILSVPVGFAWAGVAIYMEETKQWATQDSLVYFSITLLKNLILCWPARRPVREQSFPTIRIDR